MKKKGIRTYAARPYIQMNHTNNVKMTGSAFESPGDAATVLLQLIWLLIILFGLQEERRN